MRSKVIVPRAESFLLLATSRLRLGKVEKQEEEEEKSERCSLRGQVPPHPAREAVDTEMLMAASSMSRGRNLLLLVIQLRRGWRRARDRGKRKRTMAMLRKV